jgi:hypothetical protein
MVFTIIDLAPSCQIWSGPARSNGIQCRQGHMLRQIERLWRPLRRFLGGRLVAAISAGRETFRSPKQLGVLLR